MSQIEVTLRQEEAKLVYLAVAYHLGRPGSELDPITKQPVEHGLAEVARDLQPQLRMAAAQITVNNDQATRLQSGMLGTISELKAFSMLQPRPTPEGALRRSTVPGFDASLLHLYPEVEEDTQLALDIAEQMLLLKRRLDPRLAELPPEDAEPEKPKKRGWWPFGR